MSELKTLSGQRVVCLGKTVPLFTQEYEWVPAICQGSLMKCKGGGGQPCNGLASHPGRELWYFWSLHTQETEISSCWSTDFTLIMKLMMLIDRLPIYSQNEQDVISDDLFYQVPTLLNNWMQQVLFLWHHPLHLLFQHLSHQLTLSLQTALTYSVQD